MPRWIVPLSWLVFIVMILLVLILPLTVWAAPAAKDSMECGMAADMLLTARALAQEKIAEKKIHAILARMYAPAAIEKWADALVTHAQRASSSAEDLSVQFQNHCTGFRGNVDGLLGIKL